MTMVNWKLVETGGDDAGSDLRKVEDAGYMEPNCRESFDRLVIEIGRWR